MESGLYVSLSGQLAFERRLETIAHNIANASTPGFRSSGVTFGSITSNIASANTQFSSTGKNFVLQSSGGMKRTEGQLDIAVQGNGFLQFESPSGIYYSRDGRLSMLPDGQLVSLTGHPVLDAGGAPVALDPRAGEVTIARDGSVFQDGSKRGAIGLVVVDFSNGFTRTETSGFRTNVEAQPVTNFLDSGVLQGYLEESNVNPITEMVRMIEVTRAFESVTALSERAYDAEKAAIQALASR